MHSITLTCDTCQTSKTFTAEKRYMLVQKTYSAKWSVGFTVDLSDLTATCGDCHGSNRNHFDHAEAVWEGAA